jgi:hypothetical protein
MRSQLSRGVFRALLANRPYAFAGCEKTATQWRAQWTKLQSCPTLQSRPVFGLSLGSTPRTMLNAQNTPVNVEKALAVLVDLARSRRTRSKLPPQAKIIEAFNFLFQSRFDTPRRFSRNEIYLATEAFKYLQENQRTPAEGVPDVLSDEDIYNALAALALDTGKERFRSDEKSLAYMMFQEARARSVDEDGAALDEDEPQGKQVTDIFISVLSSTGGATEARQLLREEGDADATSMTRWVAVLKGLANEGLDKEFWATLEEAQGTIGLLDTRSHQELTTHFAAEDNIEATKRMYDTEIDGGSSPTHDCRLTVAEFCVRNNQLGWGSPIFESLLSEHEDERTRDAILVWYAAEGKSADEIAGLVRGRLSIHNINKLIQYAYSVNDLEAVDAYRDLAKKQNVRPDRQTYLLQMKYELEGGDLPAAIMTYDLVAAEDPSPDLSDMPLLNNLLTAVAFSPRPDFDLAMRIVDSLLDRGAELYAETVSGLCHLFLQRDEFEEAMGILRYRVDSYPTSDRERISEVFRQFILNPGVGDQRAFNAYELWRHAFPETPVEKRLPLMHSFVDRKRPDLACLIFGHMRQREDLPGRPTAEAYAQCFEGIAKCKDVDGLQMVYNMLKLDLEVEQTTRIHNSLMAAYTACGMPFTAIIDHFWKIMDSREGPTLSSFALALRACETWIPQGAQEARRIIALMQSWNLVITKEIYLCYLGALAGQSEFENSIEVIEEMENDMGDKPDAYT